MKNSIRLWQQVEAVYEPKHNSRWATRLLITKKPPYVYTNEMAASGRTVGGDRTVHTMGPGIGKLILDKVLSDK